MTTRKRSTTAKKQSQARRAPNTARKRTTADTEAVLEPAEEAALAEAQPRETSDDYPVVTIMPEPTFAGRIAPPPPPRPRPEGRRGIFLDVENTSSPDDIAYVLRYLMIDRVGIDTDFTAVGNWRVIGHETARLLAQNGASLVHSAPSVGVRDWSDLRIAVAAGVWLAGTRPGDMIDIVSDDQAFDAVGDVAASLGVQYRRLSYRALTGRHAEEKKPAAATGDGRSRRRRRGSRRGGRQESPRERERPAARVTAQAPARMPAAVAEDDAHTAPHDEIVGVVRDLMDASPNGVSLDQLANALRERGFRRTPGSPRLITRLKRIKELDVGRNGMIRLGGGGHEARPVERHAASRAVDIEPASEDEGAAESDAAEGESAPAAAGQGERRRRRRRGGRRRRGRRGGRGGGGSGDGAESGGPEVVAAAAPATSDA